MKNVDIKRHCKICQWKIIPLNYVNNALVKNFKFHSNLSIPHKTIIFLHSYYKNIIDCWCKYYSCTPEVSCIQFGGIRTICRLGYLLNTRTYFDLGVLNHFAHWDVFLNLRILEHFRIENKKKKIVIIQKDF